MRILNDKIMDAVTVALSATSDNQPLDHEMVADITATITGANPGVKTFISGTFEVQTLTFPTKAGATAGDYIKIFDQSGTAWAVALNKTGSSPAPTGAIWTAIPAGKKSNVDISGATTAADVAALIVTALNALTGFTAVITLVDNADGTITDTQLVPGPTTNPIPKNADDSGAGSITGVEATPGVASNVNITSDTVTVVAHGYTTGVKEALTGATLPAGLSATNYFMIVVDANTLKFATSQANVLAGTAVDITDYGTGTHTMTPATALAGTIKLQKNNEPATLTPIWFDIVSSSQAFSAAGSLNWALTDVGFRSLQAVVTTTSGTVLVSIRINAKGV